LEVVDLSLQAKQSNLYSTRDRTKLRLRRRFAPRNDTLGAVVRERNPRPVIASEAKQSLLLLGGPDQV
jgi:hypothetical protein